MRSFQFKKNEHMVESRSFYNMLHVHVSLNQCHSLCKKTCMSMDIFQVQVVGEVGQETLFPKFCRCVDRTFCRGVRLLSIRRCAWRNRLFLCGAIFGTVFVDCLLESIWLSFCCSSGFCPSKRPRRLVCDLV